MGRIYNRKEQKSRRQYLRTHSTRAEILLWYCLKKRQLLGCKFRRQHGVEEYIVDFYCPELRIAIEIDGESHDSSAAKADDVQRQNEIEEHGIRFLRFQDQEVLGGIETVLKRIEGEILRSRGT